MILLAHIIPMAFDLLSTMLCIGLLATGMWVIPSGVPGAKGLHDGLWDMLGPVLAALTVMSVIGLLQRTVEMSGLAWGDAFSSLSLVLLKTHYGMTWFVQIAAITALWSGWWRGRKRGSRPLACVMFLEASCVVWSVSASSHAADWGDFTLPEWMAWLHIMGASLWVGGILAFVLVIWRRLRGQLDRTRALFAVCAGRLSSLAGMAVGMVLLTGAYNVWRQLGHVSELWSSDYGRIILFKIALVCAMIALGAVNRFTGLPLLRQGTPHIRRFMRRLTLEAWLALGVLVCAALLGHLMPPKKQANTIPSSRAFSGDPGLSQQGHDQGQDRIQFPLADVRVVSNTLGPFPRFFKKNPGRRPDAFCFDFPRPFCYLYGVRASPIPCIVADTPHVQHLTGLPPLRRRRFTLLVKF